MTILQLTKKIPYPAKDGETIAVLNFAFGLSAAGQQVTILAINTPKHYYDVDKMPEQYSKAIQLQAVFINTKISVSGIFINLFKKIPYHIERFVADNYKQKLKTLLQEKQFDIIQLEGLFLAPYISTIRKYSNAKIVYRSHNVEGVIWKRVAMSEKNAFQKWYLNLQANKLLAFEKKCLPLFDAIVPISTIDEQYYKQHGYSGSIKYIPSGINIHETAKSEVQIKHYTLYFLGALDWIPNQEAIYWFLEQVYPEVKKIHPEIEFYIAGRNAPERIKNIDMAGVIVIGEIEDAAKFIEDKFICVVPLQSGSGMKIKIAEAMYASKPVITTHIGAEGMPSGLEQHIFVAQNTMEFVRNIDWCLTNFNEAEEFGRKANMYIKNNLDNKRLIADLIQFYQLLGG